MLLTRGEKSFEEVPFMFIRAGDRYMKEVIFSSNLPYFVKDMYDINEIKRYLDLTTLYRKLYIQLLLQAENE